MKNYIKKTYQKIREWGWKYRQRTLHIVPETKYLKPRHLKFEERFSEQGDTKLGGV